MVSEVLHVECVLRATDGVRRKGEQPSCERVTHFQVRLAGGDLADVPPRRDRVQGEWIVYGFAAQVDGICRRLRSELGGSPATIATGGLASVIVGFTETVDRVDDLLTLKGLRLIYERNR